MSSVIKASVGLVIAVEIFTILFIVSGIGKSNPMLGLVFVVIAIVLNVGFVFWGLSMTAGENGYGKQLLNSALIGAIAGVLIFAVSMLNTSVLFPDYVEESKLATIEWLENRDLPDQMRDAQIQAIEKTTATSQAVQGLIGTFFTSLIVGAIISIFKRKK